MADKQKKIAVVAVHGVGNQQPLDSARRISDLLQDLDVGEERRNEPQRRCERPRPVVPMYQPFTGRPVRINVRPVVVNEDTWTSRGAVHGPFHAWVEQRMATPVGERPDEDLSHRFMRGQLRCFGGEAPEETYETERFEGTRDGDGGDNRTVHVYELYWADLSRLKAGILSIFTELYQLLFHLPSLGTHVVDAETASSQTPRWRRFRAAHLGASWILTVPIPVFNLLMLAVTAVVVGLMFLFHLSAPRQAVATWSLVALCAAAAIGWIIWKRDRVRPVPWILPVFALIVAIAGIALLRAWFNPRATHTAATVLLFAASSALFKLTVDVYNARRPGVSWWGWVIGAVACVVTAVVTMVKEGWLAPQANGSRLVYLLIHLYEVLFVGLCFSWIVFSGFGIWAFVAGAWAGRDQSSSGTSGPAAEVPLLRRRAIWTARLTLSLAAGAFLTVTLLGWGVLSIPLQSLVGSLPYRSIVSWGPSVTDVSALIQVFLDVGVWLPLSFLVSIAAVSALPAIWGLTPSVIAEAFPPSYYKATHGEYSHRLGQWLTRTFGGLFISGWAIYLVVTFGIPLAFIAVAVLPPPDGNTPAAILVKALGTTSGVVFGTLFSMRNRIKQYALGFGPALDLLLDVDNWLREHPSNNPRARICGRYVSLLRYLSAWRDPIDGGQYDAVVIIAHSQGTVITADLLRFLQHEPDAALARLSRDHGLDTLPIELFTMGCPLRELYGKRFPRLYGWASHSRLGEMTLQADDLVTPRDPVSKPDPSELLGVRRWINAYRSGDYVGRHLWRTDNCSYAAQPGTFGVLNFSSGTPDRGEFCVGAGAHTHYWDDTATSIAWALDDLIAQA